MTQKERTISKFHSVSHFFSPQDFQFHVNYVTVYSLLVTKVWYMLVNAKKKKATWGAQRYTGESLGAAVLAKASLR